MSKTTLKLNALAQIFRLEYLPAAAPGLLITFFLCAKSPGRLVSVPVIEGLLVVMFMVFAGLGINAITDRDIDRKYATFKSRIPDAIGLLGLRLAWAVVAIQILLACAMTIHLSIHMGHWLPLALLAGEAFFGYGYSLRPLRFKVRGVFWHGFSLLLATGLIPFVLTAYIYLGGLSLPLLTFGVGFSLVQYGWEFSNQALDYLEDRAEGLRTPAVRLGVVRALKAAMIVPIAGMCIEFAGLYWLLVERPISLVIGSLTVNTPMVWSAAVALMLLGYAIPLRGTWEMYALSRRETPEVCVPKMPALCRYAWWQASSILGVVAATAIFFLVANYGNTFATP